MVSAIQMSNDLKLIQQDIAQKSNKEYRSCDLESILLGRNAISHL